MIQPHGGTLVSRLLDGVDVDTLLEKAAGLPVLSLDSRETSDLEMIATGAMSPLEGFMAQGDYDSVLSDIRLADGTVWPLPVVLSTKGDVPTVDEDSDSPLVDADSVEGDLPAVDEVSVEEAFPPED